ncbi:MAG: FtsH protease activity modulator HflK [Rhizomicrobium sp.]|nr:FtsH protease activity modulator HflK [Rhizomicrobium sp.]
MPWKSQNGGEPTGPWGQSPQLPPPAENRPESGPNSPWPSQGGVRPPDFETLLKRFWAELRRYVPPGAVGRSGITIIALLVVGLWLVSGVYTVNPQEQGVVLRFGAFLRHTGPGTYYHLPWPIESARTLNVKKANQLDIGFKPAEANAQPEDVADESHMLTGDENIVAVQFTVYWRIKDANAYLFNVDLNSGGKSGDAVKAVAESAMREVVGQDRIDLIMTSHREEIQHKVQKLMQQMLDTYGAGIAVVGVKMQKVETPSEVREAYLDVQKALADQDKKRSEAETYKNSVIPQARGEAAHIVQEAEGYKAQATAIATGEAQRFNEVYQEYKKAPEVTRRRLYIETMSQVLAPLNKVIVDDAAKGVMPYFQLPQPLQPAKPVEAAPKPAKSDAAPSGGNP